MRPAGIVRALLPAPRGDCNSFASLTPLMQIRALHEAQSQSHVLLPLPRQAPCSKRRAFAPLLQVAIPARLTHSRPSYCLLLNTRIPFDSAEEHCTLAAHSVVVNSNFTKSVFMRAFPAAKRAPSVLYPCVTLAPSPKPDDEVLKQLRGRTVFLSINR